MRCCCCCSNIYMFKCYAMWHTDRPGYTRRRRLSIKNANIAHCKHSQRRHSFTHTQTHKQTALTATATADKGARARELAHVILTGFMVTYRTQNSHTQTHIHISDVIYSLRMRWWTNQCCALGSMMHTSLCVCVCDL